MLSQEREEVLFHSSIDHGIVSLVYSGLHVAMLVTQIKIRTECIGDKVRDSELRKFSCQLLSESVVPEFSYCRKLALFVKSIQRSRLFFQWSLQVGAMDMKDVDLDRYVSGYSKLRECLCIRAYLIDPQPP